MHLFGHLHKLGQRLLYCYADSVIFVQKIDEPPLIDCGDALRDITSELKGNDHIPQFVSGGPKNYAFILWNIVMGEMKTLCKVRSITLNYKASQLVNFDTIKDLV